MFDNVLRREGGGGGGGGVRKEKDEDRRKSERGEVASYNCTVTLSSIHVYIYIYLHTHLSPRTPLEKLYLPAISYAPSLLHITHYRLWPANSSIHIYYLVMMGYI